MRDHLSGNVMLSFDGPTVATANLQTGRVKIIATAAEARNPMLPNVPTLREFGYEMGRSGYNGLWGPPGMSPAVAEVIHQHVARRSLGPTSRKSSRRPGMKCSACRRRTCCERQRAHTTTGAGSSQSSASGSTEPPMSATHRVGSLRRSDMSGVGGKADMPLTSFNRRD